ncbi:energy-coupling factor ABC transporter permease [Shewanella acanthi]|uniref:energy-coupling factor ABC transporter permease n=1 Tax=Shewanella acanthi TaxID=2864212 RepID=UPI001C656F4E|nr:energy-coupling factor ABC transporter permease [Shewanella acanthi]QYJ77650.1 energy-coupling factor ABC transporter permease [Shewanella acanthi]
MRGSWSNWFAQIDWSISLLQCVAMVLLAVWIYAIWPRSELQQVLREKSLQWRLLYVLLAINTLWLVNASIQSGLHLHFLGIVTFLLMFGWRLATVVLLLPSAFFSVFVLKQPAEFAAFSLFSVAIPLFCAFIFYSRSYHLLPKHIFVFIFVGAFINAGLSMVSHQFSWAIWMWISSDYEWSVLLDNYLVLIPLLAFPEALLNGMAVTLMVVYQPQWLIDFSDREYLWRS